VRESPIHGRGLFAKAGTAQGEIVLVKGEYIVNRETLAGEGGSVMVASLLMSSGRLAGVATCVMVR